MILGITASSQVIAAGGGGVTSTQWRLYNMRGPTNDQYDRIRVGEVEMRATVGGADQCDGGTASSSSTYLGNTADRAFANDGSTTYFYGNSESTVGGPVYLQYTFATAVHVAEYNVMSAFNQPERWDFQYHNGTTWVTVDSQTGQQSALGGSGKAFAIAY